MFVSSGQAHVGRHDGSPAGTGTVAAVVAQAPAAATAAPPTGAEAVSSQEAEHPGHFSGRNGGEEADDDDDDGGEGDGEDDADFWARLYRGELTPPGTGVDGTDSSKGVESSRHAESTLPSLHAARAANGTPPCAATGAGAAAAAAAASAASTAPEQATEQPEVDWELSSEPCTDAETVGLAAGRCDEPPRLGSATLLRVDEAAALVHAQTSAACLIIPMAAAAQTPSGTPCVRLVAASVAFRERVVACVLPGCFVVLSGPTAAEPGGRPGATSSTGAAVFRVRRTEIQVARSQAAAACSEAHRVERAATLVTVAGFVHPITVPAAESAGDVGLQAIVDEFPQEPASSAPLDVTLTLEAVAVHASRSLKDAVSPTLPGPSVPAGVLHCVASALAGREDSGVWCIHGLDLGACGDCRQHAWVA